MVVKSAKRGTHFGSIREGPEKQRVDAGWLALLIAVAVVFAFFVLVQHWQRVLRHQAWSVRRLTERIGNIESVADPQFLERLGEASPMPLEQVFTLSFRMDDRFWSDALRASQEELKFAREFGSLVGSVKLERWRSHTIATITEVLPDRKAAGWQTRSLELYSDAARISDSISLWELPLARVGPSAERPPSLELLLRANSIELRGHFANDRVKASGNGNDGAAGPSAGEAGLEDVVFFRVPLDAAQLAPFRSHDPAGNGHSGNGDSAARELAARPGSWQAFYSERDESLGIEWQLRLRDLTKKSEWERWKILDSPTLPLFTEQQ